MSAEWIERTVDESAVRALEAVGNARLLARLLALRGVTPDTLDAFLHPSLANLASPGELPGVAEAVERIYSAILARERIVVFGDYDCDGVSATAIMVKATAALGYAAEAFLPERLSEGYGMSRESVTRLLAEHPGVKLVITVDNGINAVDEIASLKAKGIDTVVIDHHLPGPVLPGCPIVNPKVAASARLSWLCGAGAAFFVANALIAKARESGAYNGGKIAGPLVVLAGLATITDIMPLEEQNRILVASALSYFRRYAPPGLVELLLRASRTTPQTLDTHDFGFLIGPRINAAGRMGSATDALKLVLAENPEEAREYARVVDGRNLERKSVEQKMTDEAKAKLVDGAPAQVIDLPDGHPGVAGIVAARMLEHLSEHSAGGAVPVCIAVGSHGSARAPDGYNLRDAFTACDAHLANYGGHAVAGGFSVKEGAVDAFRSAFAAACAAQREKLASGGEGAPPTGARLFDAWVKGSDLTLEFVESLASLAPFGEGNPEPLFAIRGAILYSATTIGADARHLRLSFVGSIPEAIWWGHGGDIEKIRMLSRSPLDLLFTTVVSGYGGNHVELRLVAVRETRE